MSSDPARQLAYRSYWAALQIWADARGLDKEKAHVLLKEIKGIKSLANVTTSTIMNWAFEIDTINNGGPGL